MSWPADLVLSGNYSIDKQGNPTTVKQVERGILRIINRNPNVIYFIKVLTYRDCYSAQPTWTNGIGTRLVLDKHDLKGTTTIRMAYNEEAIFDNGKLSDYYLWGCLTEYEFQFESFQTVKEYQAGAPPEPVMVAPEPEEPTIWENIERLALILTIGASIIGGIFLIAMR